MFIIYLDFILYRWGSWREFGLYEWKIRFLNQIIYPHLHY